VNRKRVRRLYRLERLQLRMRVRRRAGLRLFFAAPPTACACRARGRRQAVSTGSFLLPPAGAGAARLRPGGRIFSSTRRKWRHSPRAAGRGHRPGCRRLLSNRVYDLFLRELRPLHRFAPFVRDRRSQDLTSVSTCRRFPGRRQPHDAVLVGAELTNLRTRRPRGPAVVPAGGDAQVSAHHPDGKRGAAPLDHPILPRDPAREERGRFSQKIPLLRDPS
jgi:hypothetical protein